MTESDDDGKFIATGFLNGAEVISSQKYRNEDIINEKIKNKDFDVFVSPEFSVNGDKKRVLTDGHHSLEAAIQSGNNPNFIEQSSKDNDNIFLLEKRNIEEFLEAQHHGDDYHNIITKRDVW